MRLDLRISPRPRVTPRRVPHLLWAVSTTLLSAALCLSLSTGVWAAKDPAASAAPTLDDRVELLSLLDRAQAETVKLAMAASAENWNRKPAADRWSVGDVVQHLVLAERGLLAKVQKMAAEPERPDWQSLEIPTVDALVALISDRSQKATAPEVFHPKETWTRQQAIQAFLETRHSTRSYVLATQDALEAVTAPSPFGSDLTATRYLAVIGAHNLRHNGQIREIVAAD